MDIIGIKCAAGKTRLLKEFFSQLASPVSYEKQIGFFIPTGALHTLGAKNYAKLISENHAFIQSVIAIPVGDFQHATLDIPFLTDHNMDIDQITLKELISDQEWCLAIEKTSLPNKVVITTLQENLEKARSWIDLTLPSIYTANIEDKLDVMTLKKMLPRRLDKPTQTAAVQAYAANLCQHASYAKITTSNQPQPAQQSRTCKTPLVDVSFDDAEFPPLQQVQQTTNATTMTTSNSLSRTTAESATMAPATPPYDYKAELERLSKEIKMKLRPQFEQLFSQLEQKIDSLVRSQEDQEKVNINVSKQLNFLVENVTKLLKNPVYQLHNNTQSPCSGDGHS